MTGLRIALDVVGFILVVGGFVPAITRLLLHGRDHRTAYLVMAVGFFLGGVARWLDRNWAVVGVDVFFCAFYGWLWWHHGGDDDWRKRRRRVTDWARSHIPRPSVIQLRPIPVAS